jgi:hypothetical protein
MAPTLRSSAPSTPTAKTDTTSDISTVTPRKTPQCTKCKRPRQGHPRSGCPYADSPLKEKQSNIQTANNITDALGSMYIASPSLERDEDTKAATRNRRRSSVQPPQLAPGETLVSLSSNSQEIIERLMQPGMFDDDTGDDAGAVKNKTKAKIVRWQETVQRPVVKMPGTLTTPSPQTSQESLKTLPYKQETSPTPELGLSSIDVSSTPSSQRRQPLARSMSMEQRQAFVSNLTSSSHATIYVLPSSDIYSIHASAIKVGLHARVVQSMDKSDPQGLLVLGHDEKAVQRLYEKVETESQKSPSGRLRAAAGGAVVGVVGAWAGLAFT